MKQWVGKPPVRNEWESERAFREKGPFYHLHTAPLETDVIFTRDDERAAALIFMAIATQNAGVDILAYALMSNHFHFVLKGEEASCLDFYSQFIRKLKLFFSRHGRPRAMDGANSPEPTPITSLKQFRDEVVYVIRNPFVVRQDINLFAYPWCSGFLYFNPLLSWITTQPADKLTLLEKRAFTYSREAVLPKGFSLVNGIAYPGSFVKYHLVEMMFTDARQFQFWMFKNVEAQVETALRLGDRPSLSDDELLPVSLKLCRDKFGARGPSALTEKQKYDLAKQLKYDYYASNGQVARFTGLQLRTINDLFPLSAKNSSK